jgi:hypothetical protein
VVGSAGSAVISDGLPKSLALKVVERLPKPGPAAPSLLHDCPVRVEAQAKVRRLPEFGAIQFTAFGEIDQAKQKERFVRREAALALQPTPADCRIEFA